MMKIENFGIPNSSLRKAFHGAGLCENLPRSTFLKIGVQPRRGIPQGNHEKRRVSPGSIFFEASLKKTLFRPTQAPPGRRSQKAAGPI